MQNKVSQRRGHLQRGWAVASRWSHQRILLGACLLTVLLLSLSGSPAFAALGVPKSQVWPFFEASESTSADSLDHSAWDQFLKQYVKLSPDGIHRVAYKKVSAADRANLASYVKQLERTRIRRFRRAEQFAFWVNLYNALTVQLVLEHPEAQSIREIDSGWSPFQKGPWHVKRLHIESQRVSLNDIEHRILRPIWRDPRVHYALNCASLGCPNLLMEAFSATNSERLLEAAAEAFINHPRAVTLQSDGSLQVSSIFVWFQADFGGSEAALLRHLRRYAAPTLRRQLLGQRRVSSHHYNWGLNQIE